MAATRRAVSAKKRARVFPVLRDQKTGPLDLPWPDGIEPKH